MLTHVKQVRLYTKDNDIQFFVSSPKQLCNKFSCHLWFKIVCPTIFFSRYEQILKTRKVSFFLRDDEVLKINSFIWNSLA